MKLNIEACGLKLAFSAFIFEITGSQDCDSNTENRGEIRFLERTHRLHRGYCILENQNGLIDSMTPGFQSLF